MKNTVFENILGPWRTRIINEMRIVLIRKRRRATFSEIKLSLSQYIHWCTIQSFVHYLLGQNSICRRIQLRNPATLPKSGQVKFLLINLAKLLNQLCLGILNPRILILILIIRITLLLLQGRSKMGQWIVLLDAVALHRIQIQIIIPIFIQLIIKFAI